MLLPILARTLLPTFFEEHALPVEIYNPLPATAFTKVSPLTPATRNDTTYGDSF